MKDSSGTKQNSFLAHFFVCNVTLLYLNPPFIPQCIIFDRDKHPNLHMKAME